HLLFAGGRGPLSVRLIEPKADAELDAADTTAPDFPVGAAIDTHAALLIRNNTPTPAADLLIETTVAGGTSVTTPVPPLGPCSLRKIGFKLVGPAPVKDGPVPVRVRLLHKSGEHRELAAVELQLRAVPPEATHRRTFISGLDGSVQYFSVVPAKPSEPGKKPGL